MDFKNHVRAVKGVMTKKLTGQAQVGAAMPKLAFFEDLEKEALSSELLHRAAVRAKATGMRDLLMGASAAGMARGIKRLKQSGKFREAALAKERSMPKLAFFEGFEKAAVSSEWIMKKMVGGIMQRAGKDPTKGFGKFVHRNATEAAVGVNEAQGMARGAHWRSVDKAKGDSLAGVRQMNKMTKDPAVAKQMVGHFERNTDSTKRRYLAEKGKTLMKVSMHPAAELAGLGMLAAPSVQHLRGKHMEEGTKHKLEVAGLGVLAAPYAKDVAKRGANMALKLFRKGK